MQTHCLIDRVTGTLSAALQARVMGTASTELQARVTGTASATLQAMCHKVCICLKGVLAK